MPGPEERKQEQREMKDSADLERFEELSRQARERDYAELEEHRQLLDETEQRFQAKRREYRAKVEKLENDLGMKYEDITLMYDIANKYLLGEYDNVIRLKDKNHPYYPIAEKLQKSTATDEEKKRLFWEEVLKLAREREPWLENRQTEDIVKCIDIRLPDAPEDGGTVGEKELYAYNRELLNRTDSLAQAALELRRILIQRKEALEKERENEDEDAPEIEKTPAEKLLDDFWSLFNDIDYETVRKRGDKTEELLKMLSPEEDGTLTPTDRLLDLYTDYLIEAHDAKDDPSRIVPTKEEADILNKIRRFNTAMVRLADMQDEKNNGGLVIPSPDKETENGKKIHRVNAAGREPVLDDENAHFSQVKYNLFAEGPRADDVKQGNLGDCYFLAALSAIAAQDPSMIRNAMRDNKDGTVTVRFYNEALEPVYVTVDKTIPMKNGTDLYASGGKEALWVKIMEKAYVQSGLDNGKLKKAEAGTFKGKYKTIEGGTVFDAVSMLLGQKQGIVTGAHKYLSLTSKSGTGDYTDKEREYAAALQEALSHGQIVTAGNLGRTVFLGTSVDKEREKIGGMSLEDAGLMTFHAYSVTGIEEKNGKYYVTVRNPHAKRGVNSAENGERLVVGREAAQGYSRLELRDFSSYFPYVTVNTVDVSVPCRQRLAESSAMVRYYGDAVRRIAESLTASDSPMLHFQNSAYFRKFRDSAVRLNGLMQSEKPDAEKLIKGLDSLFRTAKAYENYCDNDKKLSVFKDSRRAFVRYQASKIADELKNVYDQNKDKTLKDKWKEFSYSAAENKADVPATCERLRKTFRTMADSIAERMMSRTGDLSQAKTRKKLYEFLNIFADEGNMEKLRKDAEAMNEDKRYDFLQKNARAFCTSDFVSRHAREIRQSMRLDGYVLSNPRLESLLGNPQEMENPVLQ